jgi:hypothetical protein
MIPLHRLTGGTIMKSKRLLSLVLIVGLASVACGAVARAEGTRGSGQVVYVEHRSEELELPNGERGFRTHNKGVVTAEQPETPFHMSTQDCVGTTILSADGEIASSGGYCDGIDRQGDVWLISWYDGYWTFLGGTGKYARIQGGGTTRQGPAMAGGRSVVFWEGEWRTE